MTHSSTAAQIHARFKALSRYREILLNDDKSERKRRVAGYGCVRLARASAAAAFAGLQGIESVAHGNTDHDTEIHRGGHLLLEFLEISSTNAHSIDPAEELAMAIADRSDNLLVAVCAARAAYALLGPKEYGAQFVLLSMAILLYDRLDPDEYRDFNIRIREAVLAMDPELVAEAADEFELPGVWYAKNASVLNGATRYHEAILRGLNSKGHSEQVATYYKSAHDLILRVNRGDFDPEAVALHEVEAEHAAVSYIMGNTQFEEKAWSRIIGEGGDPAQILSRLERFQSCTELKNAVSESIRRFKARGSAATGPFGSVIRGRAAAYP